LPSILNTMPLCLGGRFLWTQCSFSSYLSRPGLPKMGLLDLRISYVDLFNISLLYTKWVHVRQAYRPNVHWSSLWCHGTDYIVTITIRLRTSIVCLQHISSNWSALFTKQFHLWVVTLYIKLKQHFIFNQTILRIVHTSAIVHWNWQRHYWWAVVGALILTLTFQNLINSFLVHKIFILQIS